MGLVPDTLAHHLKGVRYHHKCVRVCFPDYSLETRQVAERDNGVKDVHFPGRKDHRERLSPVEVFMPKMRKTSHLCPRIGEILQGQAGIRICQV